MKRKYQILLVLTGLIVILDQLTKWLVLKYFKYGESKVIIPDLFDLTYIRNTGAAFGILAHAEPAFRIPFFVIVPLVALGSIAWIFRKIGDTDVKLSIALSLVIGGAIGNLIDRIIHGFVIDFLYFHWKHNYFPAFNVADSAICVGVGILMLDLLKQKEEPRVSASS